jgi:hypothetical protein
MRRELRAQRGVLRLQQLNAGAQLCFSRARLRFCVKHGDLQRFDQREWLR